MSSFLNDFIKMRQNMHIIKDASNQTKSPEPIQKSKFKNIIPFLLS